MDGKADELAPGQYDQASSDNLERPKDSEVAKNTSPGANDNHIVDWDGDDDPQNPRYVFQLMLANIELCPDWKTLPSNWSGRAKAFNIFLIVILTLLTPLASSMFAPGVPQVLRTFHSTSTTIAELVVSIYIIGFAIGPLLISPLSEIYGRYPVYFGCNVMFVIFTVACAVSQSMTQLIVFRFFAGCFGVCPVTLGGASISDLIPQEKRGASMALFGMGPLMGTVLAPCNTWPLLTLY